MLKNTEENRRESYIEWNTAVLLDSLRKVVARRYAIEQRDNGRSKSIITPKREHEIIQYEKYVATRSLTDNSPVVVPFADYEEDLEEAASAVIELDPEVVAQTRSFVEECESRHNEVHDFHNFEHSSRK